MKNITQYLRQLSLPGGVILLCTFAAQKSGLSSGLSWEAVELSVLAVGVAAIALAWRFHLPRVALAAVTLALVTRGSLVFSPQSEPIAHGCMLTFLAIAGPLNLAFLLLIDEDAFDLESLAWWTGVAVVEGVLIYVVSRNEPLAVVRWLRWSLVPSTSALSFLSPIVLISAICVGVLALFATLTRKPSDFSMVWTAICIPLAFPLLPSGGEAIYFLAAVLILGAGVLETSYAVAYQDELTGLPARRAFNRLIENLNGHYSIAVVDIDHFKKFNDTYGHDVGDQVLRMVANRLARVTGGGKAFRCGGEEFAIVFTRTGVEDAADHLEMLREDIELTPFIVRGPDRSNRKRDERRKSHDPRKTRGASVQTTVTVSIGVAEPRGGVQAEDVNLWADRALYQAKEQGRNQVVCFRQPGGRSSSKQQRPGRSGEPVHHPDGAPAPRFR